MADNVQIKTAVISVSDTRRENDDVSGVTLIGLLIGIGAEIIEKQIVSDDLENIRQALFDLSRRDDVNLIFTTGGTGFSERDNTPEATLAVIEKQAPGLAEAMRLETAKKTPTAILSRGVCGIRGNCLIINFPGSPKGVQECFDVIQPVLQHAVNLVGGKINH